MVRIRTGKSCAALLSLLACVAAIMKKPRRLPSQVTSNPRIRCVNSAFQVSEDSLFS
ncbi:hypothetical protein M758_11G146300 [Ceratodon purpureus]|uniref:Uncharacterized protein n=1 Tax=Ceratodon purpureus TaxID=3225 RepID=A0A8T0GHD1_CERPU|nr:hypothetical protein KC19_11G150800 [Ceratodon purpureus]KAG0601896.1 hypothetical protein M758_11G146300 [Ceratodon purpureus]